MVNFFVKKALKFIQFIQNGFDMLNFWPKFWGKNMLRIWLTFGKIFAPNMLSTHML